MGCRYLYVYEDAITGGRYMGCLNKVFNAEIDLDLFLIAERNGGFGGIKMTGEPLPQCHFRVEKAYEGEGPGTSASTRLSSTPITITTSRSAPSISATRSASPGLRAWSSCEGEPGAMMMVSARPSVR